MNAWILRYRTELLIAAGTALLSYAVFSFTSLRFPNDDQFILYRYIDNIVAGHGFVYNLGERVLGSTTPLFTLLAALLKAALPFVPTPDVVAYLNIALLAASAPFFYLVAKRFISVPWALLAVSVYALNLSRTIPEGMETPLFLLTVFAFLHFLLSGAHYKAAVLLSLAVLTRPDAGLIAVVAAIYWLFSVGFLKTVRIGTVAALVLLPWLIFATVYFGSFVPQSLQTKLHSDDIYSLPALQGAKVQAAHISRIYWGRVVDPEHIPTQLAVNFLPVLLLSALGAWVIMRRHAAAWLLAAIPILYFASFAISNPIIFPWYLSEMEPFWILLSVSGAAYVLSRINRSFLTAAAALILLIGPLFYYTHLLTTTDAGSKVTAFQLGEYLKEHRLPEDRVGIADIGIVGYVSGAYIVDFIGLVSPESVSYYPVPNRCAPKELYTIPPELILAEKPEWMVAGSNQMDPCFVEDPRFTDLYEVAHDIQGARIYRLKD